MTVREDTSLLVSQARQGKPDALSALLYRYETRLRLLIERRLGKQLRSFVSVDDVYQETCLRAVESIQHFRPRGKDALARWIGTLAENSICTFARRRYPVARSRMDGLLAGSRASPSKNLRDEERLECLQSALDSLKPDFRRVIELTRIQGLAVKTAARHLRRTPGATSVLLYRALVALRDALADSDSATLPVEGNTDFKAWHNEGGASEEMEEP